MPINIAQNKLESLLDISTQLSCANELESILQTIADVAADLTASEGSSILLFEEETQQLYFAAARSDNREGLMQIRVPLEKSVAGKVYKLSKKMLISNAEKDPLIFRTVEKFLKITTRNLIAFPIIFGDKTLGTLEVINKLERQEYTPEDQRIIETLASYVGISIQVQRTRDDSFRIIEERKKLTQQKTDFIAIASHELRSPLGLVLGHATFLREIIRNEIYQNQLDVIIRNAERLKEIINRLSQAENFESGTASIRWQHIDVRSIIQSVVQSYQEEARECEISLQLEIPSEPSPIYCDPAKLGVAVGNIIKNALVFSRGGSPVQVSLEQISGYVQITVADSGIGIPAEDLHRIFERFYQVEHHLTRNHGGMGLGLSVTKAIVESHGGQIWVESTLGEGSTFMILLPIENLTSE
jgi:signal transduction histidine kinase